MVVCSRIRGRRGVMGGGRVIVNGQIRLRRLYKKHINSCHDT